MCTKERIIAQRGIEPWLFKRGFPSPAAQPDAGHVFCVLLVPYYVSKLPEQCNTRLSFCCNPMASWRTRNLRQNYPKSRYDIQYYTCSFLQRHASSGLESHLFWVSVSGVSIRLHKKRLPFPRVSPPNQPQQPRMHSKLNYLSSGRIQTSHESRIKNLTHVLTTTTSVK